MDGGTPPRRVSGVSAVACTDTRSRRHLRARGIGYCDGVSLGRPTIIDVARAAGTSKSVVSRVITGKGSVSADARARVVAAMAQLGYRSNPAARTLQSGRFGSVGVLLRNVTSAFYCTLFASLQRLASVDGSRVVGATGNMIQGSERAALDNLLDLGVDALIIGSGTMPIRTITRVSERIPTVVLTRPVPDTAASAVYDDPDQHARLCVGALWEAGHRDIALFDATAFSAQPRIQAIRREANERGMRLNTVSAGYDLQPGREAARVWLAGARQETGLLFLGFEAAVGAMYELGQAGCLGRSGLPRHSALCRRLGRTDAHPRRRQGNGYGGHGEVSHLLLHPGSPESCRPLLWAGPCGSTPQRRGTAISAVASHEIGSVTARFILSTGSDVPSVSVASRHRRVAPRR